MISLRPITLYDQEFLYQVYTSTREQEMAILDLNESQKEDFLKNNS